MDLGSLNMENIENILSSMSSEDMEMLSGMAQSLFSSVGQRDEKESSGMEEVGNGSRQGFVFCELGEDGQPSASSSQKITW